MSPCELSGTSREEEEEVGGTVLAEGCTDLDGGEVLQERVELPGGELRPPPAAGLLVQPVEGQQRSSTTTVAMVTPSIL